MGAFGTGGPWNKGVESGSMACTDCGREKRWDAADPSRSEFPTTQDRLLDGTVRVRVNGRCRDCKYRAQGRMKRRVPVGPLVTWLTEYMAITGRSLSDLDQQFRTATGRSIDRSLRRMRRGEQAETSLRVVDDLVTALDQPGLVDVLYPLPE